MLGNVGLLVGLVLLMFMALRGVNIFIAALVCALLVALSNNLPAPQALLEFFPFGPLGAFTFAGKFFVLFLCGAIFGKAMATSQAASSIAQAIIATLGIGRMLWVTLMREANLPKRLFCAATALGAGTFTMTALPGSPSIHNSIHNVIATSTLGTDLFTGAWISLLASALMVGLGMAYVQREWRLARERGDGFEANAQDLRMEQLAGAPGSGLHWGLAVLPIAVGHGGARAGRGRLDHAATQHRGGDWIWRGGHANGWFQPVFSVDSEC